MSEEFSSASKSSSSANELQNLKAEVELLNKTVTAALFIMLLIAVSLVFALRRQMVSVREDLVNARLNVTQPMEQYEKEKPNLKSFLANLDAYSKAHPDFAPIMNKYKPALKGLMDDGSAGGTGLSGGMEPPNPGAPTLK